MSAVRLTVTYRRRKGRPHAPETAEKGGRVTEVCASWPEACVRLAELSRRRPVSHAAVTAIDLADRNHERGTRPCTAEHPVKPSPACQRCRDHGHAAAAS